MTATIMDFKQNSVLSLFSAVEHSSPALLQPVSRKAKARPPASALSSALEEISAPLVGYAFVPSSFKTAVPEADIFPSGIGILAKGHQFSIFKKSHADEAATVVNYLVSCDCFEKFQEDATRLREILNEGIYLYAISTAVLHRKDTSSTLLPPLWQVNPRNYFPGPIIKRAFDQARRGKSDASDGSTPPAFTTGSNRDPEFKLAWWREDCGFNAHHYHWHQSYPWRGVNGVTKDRQGELFYYMHQQMLARYDAERLAVGLMRVDSYSNWHLPIPEGYNPQLTDYYGAYQFAARPAGMILADNWRDPSDPTLIIQQGYHRDRLLDAINTGKFEKAGGVMGDTSAAIRDPIFFRWHKFVDDLFFLHKIKLTPYNQTDLEFQNVQVDSVQVQVNDPARPANTLITRMEDVVVDIANDMFLNPNDKPNTEVNVTVKQVNHGRFNYKLGVTSNSRTPLKAAIRIFIAPSLDEHGTQYQLDSQRRLFIEMDKFVTTLKTGSNAITRRSTRSSVIKPRELTIAELKKRGTAAKEADDGCACRPDRYCECGWPEHMLVPRGTAAGMPFDLFVMVTNWANDSSTDDLDRGTSYCGVKDKTYPDKRPMGFPFDRKIDSALYKHVADFSKGFSNMKTLPIKITCV
ncbi:hemocyanin AA6 chain-like isoform X2 [Patiria miniata]|uniref:Tyrosinase copper-binding domain-containing protein n=1 Tax=Patiria miniata TaxID=46514 RepID=A0A914AZF0_PATMI|nr:hemocyanin AA6 chain-like isoform X2 [Patiria miniata]